MKYLKEYQLATLIFYVCCLIALAIGVFPPIKEFLIWLLPEHDPQLTLTTLILSLFTALLVNETRKLGEIDRKPWLFINGIHLSLNSKISCTLKNNGKIPILFQIEDFDIKIDDKEIIPAITFYNSGGEIFQGETQDFSFGYLQSEEIIRFIKEWQQQIQQNQPLKIFYGFMNLSLKYSRIDGGHEKRAIKNFSLEIAPVIGENNGAAIITGFNLTRFENN